MSTKSLIIAIVGAGCIAAAGAGGFLAQRISSSGLSAEPGPAEIPQAAVTPEPGSTVDQKTLAIDPPAGPRAVKTPRVESPPRPTVRPASPASASPAPTPAPPPPADTVVSGIDPTVVAETALPVPSLPAPAPEPVSLPERPEYIAPRFVETTVTEDTVVGIRLEATVSSDTAKVEDRVTARVTRDVIVDGRTAIPAGAQLEGIVTMVDRGGRFKERARLGIHFTRLVLSEGTSARIQTDVIVREGESPTGEATSKIGASAVVGAILGGVIGGKRGAAIGGSAGAAGGTAAVVAGGRNDAIIEEGAPLTVRLTESVTLLIERQDVRQ